MNYDPEELEKMGWKRVDSAQPDTPEIEAAADKLTADSETGSISENHDEPGLTPSNNNNNPAGNNSANSDNNHQKSEYDFRRFRRLKNKEVPYDILKDPHYKALLNDQKPYNAGYLLLEFIQRRQTGSSHSTAAQNIKTHPSIILSELCKFNNPDDSVEEDYQKSYKELLDSNTSINAAQLDTAIQKARLLYGRLNCRFRSLFDFVDGDLLPAIKRNNGEEAEKTAKAEITKALYKWATRNNGDSGTRIFEKNAQDEVIKLLQKKVAELPNSKKKEKLSKRIMPPKGDLLTAIEEEMDARRRNRKMATAALFQDLTCNPKAVMFINASAFAIMDGDTFQFVGGRVEEWTKLVAYAMKFIHDRDPWSARPNFEGSPEFVAACISIAREYTWRPAPNKQTDGWGYSEAFFQFGDQLQHIQQASPQMHTQGFWIETMIWLNPDDPIMENGKPKIDKNGQPMYNPYLDDEGKVKTIDVPTWDPEIAHAADKDIHWTFVRNLACKRPDYNSGVLRKAQEFAGQEKKHARQGVVLRMTDGKINSNSLVDAKLSMLDEKRYKAYNKEAFDLTYLNGLEGRTPAELQLAQQEMLAAKKVQEELARQAAEKLVKEAPDKQEEVVERMRKHAAQDVDDPLSQTVADVMSESAGPISRRGKDSSPAQNEKDILNPANDDKGKPKPAKPKPHEPK